ncbi:MAG: hypothetical protein LBT38_07820 [Deltaproteobacteria bacterium]|jgi:DNA polymerase III delta' subunit|nr:hypothetical protein [Deltaproteobacteria bacterium]
MPWSLIGQENLKENLGRIIQSGRFPHALLLTGPALGGKFTLAQDIAKALNCLEPESNAAPCGQCVSCRKIEEGHHPDFFVCRPKGAAQIIAIDDIRETRHSLSYRPFEGRYRVAIIREADHFRSEGGNSLLKILEEPGGSTVLILTAISESRVMTTLVSRCVRLRVPPLERATLLSALKERRSLSGPRAELLAGLSGGALGAALTMDPEVAWNRWMSLDLLFGQSLESKGNTFKAWSEWATEMTTEMDNLRKLDAEDQKKSEPANPGNAPSDQPQENLMSGRRRAFYTSLITFLRLWWRDVMVLAATNDRQRLSGPTPTPAQRKWAKSLGSGSLDQGFKCVDQLEEGLNRQIRPDLVLTNFWLSLLTSSKTRNAF